MTQLEYLEASRQALRDLADNVGQGHYTKKTVDKQRLEQARQTELELISHLDNIVERIKSDGSKDIGLLQRKYDKEVEYVLRSSLTSAWVIAINYTGMRKHSLHHTFITASDIEKIKSLVNDYTNMFWRRVNIFLHQNDVLRQVKIARFSPNSRFNINSLITGLAVNAITKTIARGTITKLRAINSTNRNVQL